MSRSKSRPEYVPGQRGFITDLFSDGGYFNQVMAGKPSQAQERAQMNGAEMLKRQQAQAGTANTPLATRQLADYAQQSQGQYQDDLFKNLALAMPPGGTSTLGASGLLGGKGAAGLEVLFVLAGVALAALFGA
jgi:hypothetical protein